MPDCWACSQSGNRMKINANTKTIPVLEYGDPVRYRNAQVSDLGMTEIDAEVLDSMHNNAVYFLTAWDFGARLNMQFCVKGSTI